MREYVLHGRMANGRRKFETHMDYRNTTISAHFQEIYELKNLYLFY